MHQVKLNNILLNNVFFTNSGKNTICVDECKEEFFGVYNLKVRNSNILCEGKSDNLVYCDVSINNKIHKNIPFNVVKSKDNRILIDQKTFDGKQNFILKEEKKEDIYQEMVSDLDDGYRTKEQLVEILKESQQEKKDLSRELIDIKKQINDIQNKKEVITESLVPDEFLNYKQEMLKEFFKVTNENEVIIENKFYDLKNDIESKINELSLSSLDFFKKENTESIRDIVNEFYQEISEGTKKEIDTFKNILKKESSILEEKYDSKLKEQVDLYSKINSKLFESVEVAKKEVNDCLEDKIEKSKQGLTESFDVSFENHKKDFSEKFVSKFEKIIKDRENEIKNKTKDVLDEHNKNVNDILESKKKEIVDASEKILQESDKKVKELTKKVETLTNQLNKTNSEKKRMENLVQDAKKYTDVKMAQVLEESKRFTRVMMDMVGGGSGSVAVQYAAGGTINGDLNVTGKLDADSVTVENFTLSGGYIQGDLEIGGTLIANTILSGGRDLTEIFAGEGEGDTNVLDGGTV